MGGGEVCIEMSFLKCLSFFIFLIYKNKYNL